MEGSSIKLKAIKLHAHSAFQSERRLRVVFVSSPLDREEQLLCQNLSSKLSVELCNFNNWNEFKRCKMDSQVLTILIVKRELEAIGIGYVQGKSNIRLILLTPDVEQCVLKQNIDRYSLIVARPQQIFSYIKDLIKQQERLLRESKSHLDSRSSSQNCIKYKASTQELQWEKRVLRVVMQNSIR